MVEKIRILLKKLLNTCKILLSAVNGMGTKRRLRNQSIFSIILHLGGIYFRLTIKGPLGFCRLCFCCTVASDKKFEDQESFGLVSDHGNLRLLVYKKTAFLVLTRVTHGNFNLKNVLVVNLRL